MVTASAAALPQEAAAAAEWLFYGAAAPVA